MRCAAVLLPVALVWVVAMTVAIAKNGGESLTAIDVKAAISVDSTFPGYRADVLSDGKWIEPGKEFQHEFGHPDRLGNGGNTWVSADTEAEHWIRLDWPRPVTINQVEIWWSRDEWQPRAFRVEWLCNGQWVSAFGPESWLAATDRQSIVPVGPLATQALRIVQAPGGGGSRNFMAAQEVLVSNRPGGARPMSGARRLTAAESRRLAGRELARNIARLECPGASPAVVWLPGDRELPASWLADGDSKTVVQTAEPAAGFGVRWPIPHMIDGLALVLPGELPDLAALAIEVHDGRRWVAIRQNLRAERLPDKRQIVWSFEPTATRSVRARCILGACALTPSEIEIYRYLPPRKNVWPERLINKQGLKEQILASGEEPSFEALSLCALPMTPARALLGLKDAPHEIGVAWDGTIIGRQTLRFRFGKEQLALADCRDTVRRRLIDGWRPGTVVEGQLGPLAVRETALVALSPKHAAKPALWVRIELKNLTDAAVPASLHVEATGEGPPARFQQSALVRGDQVVLLSQSPAQAEPDGHGLRVDLTLGGKQQAHADFVCPEAAASLPALEPYRAASFDQALEWFRASWDKTLQSAVSVEVPEPRVGRMLKAVLAQLFVNGDGDIMRYGSEPSVYREQLYGVEEGYAMLALALFGFGHDAQRYLDGTYLTREFLKKVDVYKNYADRHQQYRNGLAPHYAVSVYRLTRDNDWIRKHLPLLRQCAEWTIAQRRRTMTPGAPRPLHWGLLPPWSYGGDISEVQCYALYANYCCWRGLADTAWLFGELGDAPTAKRYADEARQYREAIDRAVDGSYRKAHRPPFLPLRLYADRPDEQMDYYQLFAGCILDLAPFEKGSQHFRWIADFLEADNRTFCFLPRFRRDVGSGGLDALYGKGYLLAKLHEDQVVEFLLGFYAFLAFNMDHETFASRETNVLYASDLHVRSAYEVPDISDPLPCSSAAALHLLRHMLVTEQRAGPGEYSGNLLLLPAAPKAWLAHGKTIRIAAAPTHFGPVSFQVRSAVNSGQIEITLDPPRRNPCHAIRLRVRHPKAIPIHSVTVDGKPWPDVDPTGPWIVLPGAGTARHIVVSYAPCGQK